MGPARAPAPSLFAQTSRQDAPPGGRGLTHGTARPDGDADQTASRSAGPRLSGAPARRRRPGAYARGSDDPGRRQEETARPLGATAARGRRSVAVTGQAVAAVFEDQDTPPPGRREN